MKLLAAVYGIGREVDIGPTLCEFYVGFRTNIFQETNHRKHVLSITTSVSKENDIETSMQ